jgi:hypothetical protein
MNGEQIYNEANNQINNKEKLQYIKSLTAIQKKEYKNYQSKLRQMKFRTNNHELANTRSHLIMIKNRYENPEKYREIDKLQKRKMTALAKQKGAEIASKSVMGNILNNVGLNIFNMEKDKQKEKKRAYMREYMRKYRASKKNK